jgi:hypothetical protein
MKKFAKGQIVSKYRGNATSLDTHFLDPAIVIVEIDVADIC